MSRPYGVADERFDEAGFEVPFAATSEGEAVSQPEATFEAGSESPFAESTFEAEALEAEGVDSASFTEAGAWSEAEAEPMGYDETLAWLDMEAAHGNAEDEQESESPLGEAEREAESEAEDQTTLTAEQRAWILGIDRSALERLPDAEARARFLQQDWSDVEFPGNVPKGQVATTAIRRHWSLARSLFAAMAGVVPERRVPTTIRFRDRPVVKVPGQPNHRLFGEARDAFVRMREAAMADGVELVILSSWRSRARQAAASANQPNPAAVARNASAHMYGLAIDLRMSVPGLPVLEINTRVDRATAARAGTVAKMGNLVRMYRSPVYKWMSLRAREFGWYPYRNEPWHWEYNPPGLKERFEGATRGELEQENRLEAEYEEEYEHEYEHESEASSPSLRTFTAKALGVKVAVYVTQAARSASQVEMMLFAHGLDLCRPVFKDRPATFITEHPFRLGQLVEATGRPIVLVVPFLDWERLDANGMGFGRKWHRLAQPAHFNQVAAEALEEARAITGRSVPPKVQRLILAGHSQAYGFFDALAHEHASPHMRTGALSRLTHVWALDTTYSAPISDWRAWLSSRDDLRATVVFRYGKRRSKGSTVRELLTGIRGREFAKLATGSNGRLTVVPVAAGEVSHCAIPATYLPGLLAALPAPTMSAEDEGEALDESFEEGEDEAGLATEAEAEESEGVNAGEDLASGEWTELAGEDESSTPERFDALSEEPESEWGGESGEELAESFDEAEELDAGEAEAGENEVAGYRSARARRFPPTRGTFGRMTEERPSKRLTPQQKRWPCAATPPACMTPAVSAGEFGIALQWFTDDLCVNSKVPALLKQSAAFMARVKTLDKKYVSLEGGWCRSSPIDWRIDWAPNADGVLTKGPFIGRRVLAMLPSPSGSLFQTANALDNPYDYDLIFIQPPDGIATDGRPHSGGSTSSARVLVQWISAIAHETVHAHTFVTTTGGVPMTIPQRVAAALKEEASTRVLEARILKEIAATKDGAFLSRAVKGVAGPTDPFRVQRGFFPGEDRVTYLEHFVLTERMLDAITRENLQPTDIERIDKEVDAIDLTLRPLDKHLADPFPIFYDPGVPAGKASAGISTKALFKTIATDYGKFRFWRRVMAARWRALETRLGSMPGPTDPAREQVAQEHAKAFFGGLVVYDPLPPAQMPKPQPKPKTEADEADVVGESKDAIHRPRRPTDGGGGAAAAALDPGNFKQFVDAGRLDLEIAHVLNVLDHYPDGSWAKQSASFAHHELLVNNLLAFVKGSNSRKAADQIPTALRATEVPRVALNAGGLGPSLLAITVADIGAPNTFFGYILVEDALVRNGTQPGPGRKKLALTLVHELSHIRNRVQTQKDIPAMRRDLNTFVRPGDPDAAIGAAEFFEEMVAKHVEWRVLKDIEHKWDGKPIPIAPKPRGLFQFALSIPTTGEDMSPQRTTYLTRLLNLPDRKDYNRQIGLWLRLIASQGLFHDSPAINDTVRRQFRGEFDLVQPDFRDAAVVPDGGVFFGQATGGPKKSDEAEMAAESELADDAQLILGKWTVRLKDWVWEYEFSPGGKVSWRDTRSSEKGVGRWTVSPKAINIAWANSTTTESWARPLTPARQTGWYKSTYYTGGHRAQKVGGAARGGIVDPYTGGGGRSGGGGSSDSYDVPCESAQYPACSGTCDPGKKCVAMQDWPTCSCWSTASTRELNEAVIAGETEDKIHRPRRRPGGGGGAAIARRGPSAPSAPVPTWANAIDPFPATVTVGLDRSNASMTTEFAPVTVSTANHLCAALADVTGVGASAAAPFAALRETEMLYVGSLLKVGVMYAAFALRARVQAFANAATANGVTAATDVFDLIKRAWAPKLKALFPANSTQSFGNNQDVTVPQVDRIFTLSATGKIEFASASPATTVAALDRVGEFGTPIGLFHEWMRLMMRWSNNTAASRCVLALGYFYINGLFAKSGFFSAGKGLWISGDYAGHDWVRTAAEKSANAAGVALEQRWATAQKRAKSNFVGNALQVGRLMTAMAQDTLVDAASCAEMRALANQISGGIGSYARTALTRVGRAPSAISSKIGFGDDSFSHDCAIVERTLGGKRIRYAAVVLGSAPAQGRRDLSDLFVLLDAVVVARNP